MHLTSDLTRASWMAERFDLSSTVAGTVGAGFEAYARIFHPVPARRFDLDPSHRSDDGGRSILEEATWTWAKLARRNGRVMHPLVQWQRLTDEESRVSFADGWDAEQAREGFLEPKVLAELVDDLCGTADASKQITVGIWEGWGELQGGGVVYTESNESDADAQALYEAEFQDLVAPEVRDVMDQIRKEQDRRFWKHGKTPSPPLLKLPHRRYLLFTSSAAELLDPRWPLNAGIGWAKDMPGVTRSLSGLKMPPGASQPKLTSHSRSLAASGRRSTESSPPPLWRSSKSTLLTTCHGTATL